MLLLAAMNMASAWAYDFEADGIYYNVLKGTEEVEVTSGDNKYTGSVIIPDKVQHDGVTYGVTTIGKRAFLYCSDLISIEMPNSVTTIKNCAFAACSHLASIAFPNGVTTIESEAFDCCSHLVSIVIPSSVTAIGEFVFAGCNGLVSVSVDEGNKVYDSRDNCNAIIETKSNSLISGCRKTVIPGSVTSIGIGAFADCIGLASIGIPSSVTAIGEWAFDGCSGLTSIAIPCNVTAIGCGAFGECHGLVSICSHNSIPPAIEDEGCFDPEHHESATLYVSVEAMEAYKAAKYWKNFKNIRNMEESSGIYGVEPDGGVRENRCYGLDGRRLRAPAKGVSIVNGKKSVVR